MSRIVGTGQRGLAVAQPEREIRGRSSRSIAGMCPSDAAATDGIKMRVSKYFKLARSQPTLDFVDVDYNKDTKLFLSPRALANLPSEWGDECVHLVQNFFGTVLECIKDGRNGEAEALLRALREPNETHLGLSRGTSRGRALGEGSAHDVWRALSYSKAAKSGLITDLEDTVLLIDGIGIDIISDMTTNIIRGPLIRYTQEIAGLYEMRLSPGVPSGPVWEPQSKSWVEGFVDLPMTPVGKLLLVPKAIVRQHLAYSLEDYYRNHLLVHLKQVELDANSALVDILKTTKARVVRRGSVEKKYGKKKSDIIRETLVHPKVFEDYKNSRDQRPFNALGHEMLAAAQLSEKPNFRALYSAVRSVAPGRDQAKAYEVAVESLLSALFYPALTNPSAQHRIHQGKKIIDISYTNMAADGFFRWLSLHYPAQKVVIECKNYNEKLSNNELDQMIGRFSPSRGKVGIIVCRDLGNKETFLTRCRETAKDDNGYIMALDDDGLSDLVEYRLGSDNFMEWKPLATQFQALIN